MENTTEQSIKSTATYTIGSRQFAVNRLFAGEKTVTQLIEEEITSGVISASTLNTRPECDIIAL